MNFNDLSFLKKLVLTFTALVALLLASDAVILWNMKTIEANAARNDRTFDLTMDSLTVLRGVVEEQNAVRAYLLGGDKDMLESRRTNGAMVDEALGRFIAKTSSDEQRRRAQKLKSDIAAWRAEHVEKPLAMAVDPALHAQATIAAGRKTLSTVRAELDTIVEAQARLQDERVKTSRDALMMAQIALYAGAAIAVAAACAIGWLLSRAIARPVVQMTGVMRRLAGGDMDVEIQGRERKDEVGQMAAAVQVFKDAAIEKARLEAEAGAQRRASFSARSASAARR
jgi:methyl-accepting chemotaxis protein